MNLRIGRRSDPAVCTRCCRLPLARPDSKTDFSGGDLKEARVIKRVIVVGLDGLEPSIAEPMLAAGELPNLARLKAEGGSSRVATTSPAQTPVAWSSFATGVNPGGHGIFDFLRRDPATYRPDISLTRHEPATAFRPPRAVNLRRGATIWGELSKQGLASTVIRCPGTYPPEPIRGRMLSGMGVPDLRGGFGTATVYSSNAAAVALEGERLVRISLGGGSTIRTHLVGPPNPKDRSDLECPVLITPDLDTRSASIRLEGSNETLEVFEGHWSDWLLVSFRAGPLRTLRGIVRFYLGSLDPDFQLYASPINYDPSSPPYSISSPGDYSKELAETIGLFHTTGMVEDHGGLNNHRFDEVAFLDQCETAWQEREAMMVEGLKGFDLGMFYCLFDTPDRVQHLFWRFRDPGHASLGGAKPDPMWSRVIEDQYRRGDAMVGLALEHADGDTLVVALSDHGFGPYRREVHLNAWLREQGLLALRPGLEPGESAGDLLTGIDWSKTRAYALGLGGIYLNLQGRERDGLVTVDEAPRLKESIAARLVEVVDPTTGARSIRRVPTREELYHGPYVAEAPDLNVHFASGYRASSSTSMGGVAAAVIEDNTSKWSGDHIVDPDLVPGVLFMNRPFRGDQARLIDLAPTILKALGVAVPSVMEGSSLLP